MGKSEINLVILSPSSEVNKLTFSSISTATTVGELRAKITAAVVSHPAPGRQRLIYRGHALVDSDRTLKEIFSQDIIDNSETLSLHLVLPPEPRGQLGTPAPSSNNFNHVNRSHSPFRAHQSPVHDGNSPNNQQGPVPVPPQGPISPNANRPPQPTAEHGHAQHIHVHTTLNGHFPPQLQQAFAQIQAVNQQFAAQLAAVGNNPGFQGMGQSHFQAQPSQQSHITQPFPQNVVLPQPQPQQVRAAGGESDSGVNPQEPNLGGQGGSPAAHGHLQGLLRPSIPQHTHTGVRENRRANGERSQNEIPGHPRSINPSQGFSNTPIPHGFQLPHNNQVNGDHSRQNPTSPIGLMHVQSNLSAMEVAVAGGNPLSDSAFQQLREMLRDVPDLSPEVRSSMDTRLSGLAIRVTRLRESLQNNFSRAAQERASTQRTTQGPQSSAVYVLSSPAGPQALLVSPAGLFAGPWQNSGLAFVTPQPLLNHSHALPSQAQSANSQNLTRAQQPSNLNGSGQQIAAQGAGGAEVEQQQQQQQQQVNQARDLLRILLPLGGHLWLLIRLFGFVYFFTAGAGWRRAVLLGLVASLVFIAQTGVFRPVIQAIWDPIRRHAEGLVPLAGNEDHGAGVDAAGANNNVDAGNAQVANPGPTPQEAAERLLQERERQDINLLRQGVRRVERAVALFVASLVPGVGERHIAAREAAEAARQAGAREREAQAQAQAQREEEDARRRQEEALPVDSGLGVDPSHSGGVIQDSTGPSQNQMASPPLVEV